MATGEKGIQRREAMSPAERFQRAVQAGPMTSVERAAFHSAVARIAAQDDLRRSDPSPQMELAA